MNGNHRMQENVAESVKTLPPVTIGILTFMGMPIDQLIQVLTVFWLLFLIGEKMYAWFKAWRAKKNQKRRRRDDNDKK